MATSTIIDNEFATLWYHEESKIVHHEIHKFIHGEPIRELLLAGCKLLFENKATKWLSDDRRNSAIPQDDLEWMSAVFAPKAVRCGWRYWALVLPKSMVGQLTMKNIIQRPDVLKIIDAEIFSDPDEARAWLEKRN